MSDTATFLRQVNERGSRSVPTGVVQPRLSSGLRCCADRVWAAPSRALEGEPFAMRFIVGSANYLHQDL